MWLTNTYVASLRSPIESTCTNILKMSSFKNRFTLLELDFYVFAIYLLQNPLKINACFCGYSLVIIWSIIILNVHPADYAASRTIREMAAPHSKISLLIWMQWPSRIPYGLIYHLQRYGLDENLRDLVSTSDFTFVPMSVYFAPGAFSVHGCVNCYSDSVNENIV